VRTSDVVSGALEIHYGGTLKVTATGDALAHGDSFKLFDAMTYSGVFATLDLPVLPAGLFWETSGLSVDGRIAVTNTLPSPIVSPYGGYFFASPTITITGVDGSTIRYTTDGSDPVTSLTAVTGASPITGVTIPGTATELTLKAYATKTGFPASATNTAVYHIVDAGVWTSDSSGAWSETSKWLHGLAAGGAGITADFSTVETSSNVSVALDSSRSIGTLKFGNANGFGAWSLLAGGGTLTLDNGASKPEILVAANSVTVTAPFVGSNGFIKTGPGILSKQLASNSLTGDAIIRQGDLLVDRTNSAGSGTIILGDSLTGDNEARIMQRGSDPWPPAADFGTTNNILVAAGPTGRLVIGRQNSGNYASIYTGTITLQNNVIFRHEGADRLSIEGKITGVGNVTFEGPRTNVDNANNDYIGSTTIASGAGVQMRGGAFPAATDLTVDGRLGFDGAALTTASLTGTGVVNNWTAGNRTFTVGTNGASRDSSYSGVIQDTIAVVKGGAGTQTFSGANTYTGGTTVTGGTLLVTNTSGSGTGSSPVIVNAGATLGGSGTISGTVTVSNGATLAPGVDGVGVLSSGAVVLSGIYACQVDGAAADRVAVTGNLNLTGASLVVSAINPPAPGTYVIATYSGTRTGSFANVTSGYSVDYATPNQVKLVVTDGGTGFESWVAGFGLAGAGAQATADPDSDGIPNAVEFVLGGNPATVQDQALLPTIALVTNPGGTVPNGDYMRFTYRRVAASAYLNPGMQYDADLAGSWTSATGAPGVVEVVTPNYYASPTLADKVDVFVPRAGNSINGKLFGRLQVVVP
jgi:autotransporter-associated beta strand protein